eukprot:gene19488-26150_t
MGSFCSSPEDKYEAPKADANGKGTSPTLKQPSGSSKPSAIKDDKAGPDFGLAETHVVIKLLGTGGEGETWLCKEKDTGREVAIKLIKRPIPRPAIAIIKREIKIQADLGQGHCNIVSATEVILSKTHLGLVMEYVKGGNMVQCVTKKRENKEERGGFCLEEEEARFYFMQLLSAVEYCHKHQVAHRDVKLDNTLLDVSHKLSRIKLDVKLDNTLLGVSHDPPRIKLDVKLDNTLLDVSHDPPRIKLCDFGFAKAWTADSNMDTMRIGTPEYMGPELISSRTGYDGKKVDIWAAGVLLYVMLIGIMFPLETQDDNMNNTAGLYDIWLQQIKTSWREAPNNSTAASRLSPELKDLLDNMFEDQRPDVATIKAHPWFTKPLPAKYAPGWEALLSDQKKREELVAAGVLKLPDRDKNLDAQLDKASTAALPTEQILRVSLTKAGRNIAPAVNPMGALPEE